MRRGKGKRALAGLLAAALCAGLFFLPASAAPEGATVWGYSEGLAQCELAGKWGYVDAGRNVVIPLQYDSIVSFQLGIAAVNLNPGRILSVDSGDHSDRNGTRMKLLFIHRRLPPFNGYSKLGTASS